MCALGYKHKYTQAHEMDTTPGLCASDVLNLRSIALHTHQERLTLRAIRAGRGGVVINLYNTCGDPQHILWHKAITSLPLD